MRAEARQRWALARIFLGTVQMFVSVVGVVLLIQTGLTPMTLGVAGLAGATTVLSRMLFRGDDSRSDESSGGVVR